MAIAWLQTLNATPLKQACDVHVTLLPLALTTTEKGSDDFRGLLTRYKLLSAGPLVMLSVCPRMRSAPLRSSSHIDTGTLARTNGCRAMFGSAVRCSLALLSRKVSARGSNELNFLIRLEKTVTIK